MEMNYGILREIIVQTINEYQATPHITVGVSNRHIHLSEQDVSLLFGKGYSLAYTKELLPGQYACKETVDICGKKGKLRRVRVLGPVRKDTQLEISLTDSFALGAPAPINESGNLEGAGTVTIQNPENGASVTKACAIAAMRHIHLTPGYAGRYGLRDRQLVTVEFAAERGIIFPNVLLRVSKDFRDEMHIDTDEANAGGIKNGVVGKIVIV